MTAAVGEIWIRVDAFRQLHCVLLLIKNFLPAGVLHRARHQAVQWAAELGDLATSLALK